MGRKEKKAAQQNGTGGMNKNKLPDKHQKNKNGDVTKTSSATRVLSRAVLGTSDECCKPDLQ